MVCSIFNHASSVWKIGNTNSLEKINEVQMLLNISLMKMLKRMGEITEPCGRPILVWNHTPV
jgi:hypothetical protein